MKNLCSKLTFLLVIIFCVLAANIRAYTTEVPLQVNCEMTICVPKPKLQLLINGIVWNGEKIDFAAQKITAKLMIIGEEDTKYALDVVNIFILPKGKSEAARRVGGSGSLLERDTKDGILVPIPSYSLKKGDILSIEVNEVYQIVADGMLLVKLDAAERQFSITAK